MTWLWHDTCSVSINKSHLLIRSCWLRNQNTLSMDQVLASEHDFAENIRQVVRICVLGLFQKENLWQNIQQLSSCHLHRFCLSDLVRHSKQEGLNTIRQEAENLTEKKDISNQTIMFLCYWSHFDIFWSTGYFKCRHLCTILVLNLQSFRRDFSTGNPPNPTQPAICMVATSSGHVPDRWS